MPSKLCAGGADNRAKRDTVPGGAAQVGSAGERLRAGSADLKRQRRQKMCSPSLSGRRDFIRCGKRTRLPERCRRRGGVIKKILLL
jgi:hypothetical protein